MARQVLQPALGSGDAGRGQGLAERGPARLATLGARITRVPFPEVMDAYTPLVLMSEAAAVNARALDFDVFVRGRCGWAAEMAGGPGSPRFRGPATAE